MNDKLFITHVYSNEYKLLQSITSLSKEEAFSLAKKLSTNNQRAFKRFRNFKWYYEERLKTEKELYQAFIDNGGYPQCTQPLYFVLGQNFYLERLYGSNARKIQLDLDSIQDIHISFTLLDSMALRLTNKENRIVSSMVYNKETLFSIINNKTENIIEYLEELDNRHEYIEVQLWDHSYIKGVRDQGKRNIVLERRIDT